MKLSVIQEVQNVLFLLARNPWGAGAMHCKNSIVDNRLIQSRPHTGLLSSHIMASEQSRFESCRL